MANHEGVYIAMRKMAAPPCEPCPHYELCASRHLACEAYFMYASRTRRRGARRVPTRSYYESIFGEQP